MAHKQLLFRGEAGVKILHGFAALAEKACNGDERTGLKIRERAFEAPTHTIAGNSGFDDGVVVEKMRAGKDYFGFDAARGMYVDLLDAGIIDPTKVVRLALEHAVSIAGVLLLSDGTITEVSELEKRAQGGEMKP